jgi:hypothetical protein
MKRTWKVCEEKAMGLGDLLDWLSDAGWQVHSIHSHTVCAVEETVCWFTVIAYRDEETNR